MHAFEVIPETVIPKILGNYELTNIHYNLPLIMSMQAFWEIIFACVDFGKS